MRLLDRFRADSTVRVLRSEPVLALPASLASARVLVLGARGFPWRRR